MLTDTQIQAMQNLISALIGAGTSVGIQWVSKRRTKSEQNNDNIELFNKVAKDNILSAQSLIDMWQEMLDEKEKHFIYQIDMAKESCSLQIANLREENNILVEDLRSKIIQLTLEKEIMSREIVSLTYNKRTQEDKIGELTVRIGKYQEALDKQTRVVGESPKDKIVDIE